MVIDEREDWPSRSANTLHQLILEFGLGSASDEAKKVSQSEMLAEVAAIELMYSFG